MDYSAEEQKELATLSQTLINTPISDMTDRKSDWAASLKKTIIYHEWRYYIENDPIITDYEYDVLFSKLKEIEEMFPDLITTDSPTQRVSNDLTSEFEVVEHIKPMLSLSNSYNLEDINEFDVQIKKLTDNKYTPEYCVEPKYDGGTIVLVYEDDTLVRASTRGDGFKGEDITNNARSLKTIPLKAKFSAYGIYRAEIRGECLIKKDVFEKINADRQAENLSLFANPRNAATGSLRMKNPQDVAKRGLEAIIYQLGYAVDKEGNDAIPQFKTHDNCIEALGKLGFKIPTIERKVCHTTREISDFCNAWQDKRDAYHYELDGMVIKLNDLRLQELCGSTAHHPRWATAFKFKARQATSELLGVEFQVGKIGSVTPVAKIRPVPLAGVRVSSISLHNEAFIRSKDIRIGDQVLVERAGDVIPYIVKSFPELRNGSETVIDYPETCPSCASQLFKEEDEAVWRCVNSNCPAQIVQRIIHHASKDAMDIEGMGKSIVERFYELGIIHSIADLYNLPYEAIEKLEGFGQKSVSKLQKNIEKARQNPIHRLLYSLSIHHLGQKASKLIAEQVTHVLELQDWTFEQYVAIKDIGPSLTENVMHYFANPGNINLLHQLEALGVNLYQTEDDKPLVQPEGLALSGKTILFTGTLHTMGRKEAEHLAEKNGAKVISAVSGNLSILVVGENAGSKLTKAQNLGTIQILTEDEFLTLMNT